MVKIYHLRTPVVDRNSVAGQLVLDIKVSAIAEQAKRVWISKFVDVRYEHVADVDTNSFPDAFHLTNAIDAPWVYNAKVKVAEKYEGLNLRSTSVGDILVDPDGRPFLITSFGYTKLV